MGRAFPARPECSQVPTIEEIPLASAPIACNGGSGGAGGGGGAGAAVGPDDIPPAAAPITEAEQRELLSAVETVPLCDFIYGRNLTGINPLPVGSVVAIQQHLESTYEDVIKRRKFVDLYTIDLSESDVDPLIHPMSWGVVVERPIVSNAIGKIRVAGIEIVPMTINDSAHKFAKLVDGSQSMETLEFGGHARVLWSGADGGGSDVAAIMFPITLPTYAALANESGDVGDTISVNIVDSTGSPVGLAFDAIVW